MVVLRADRMASSWEFQMALQLGIWLDDERDPVVVALWVFAEAGKWVVETVQGMVV